MAFMKYFLVISTAAAALLIGCGDSATDSTVTNEVEIQQDSVAVQDTSNKADSGSVTDPQEGNDTTATPKDTTPVFTIPEEAAEITPTATITKDSGKGLLLDDFEDGDNMSLLGENYWYTYDDTDNDGASIILTPLTEEGYPKARRSDNGTNYAWAVYFKLDKGEYKYDPYVGWGVELPDDSTLDYAHLGGVTYWYKGCAHEIHVETSDIKDYDVHLAKLPAARTWTKASIRFKDLEQGGWGKEVAFDAAHLVKISFQAKGNGKNDSVLIDNIYLQDTSEVAKDTADMEIKDAEIPEVTIGDITITNELQAKAMKYLDKGINITNWLEEDGTLFKGTFKFNEEDVKLMADNGIKSLRLPIDLDQYATNRDKFVADTTGTVELAFDDTNLFAVLDSFVEWTGKHGMSFVIDYHEYDNSYNLTNAKKPRYTKMMASVWKHVAEHYASNEREDIFFELLNEPDMSQGKVTSALWHAAAQEDIDSIRTVDTKHTIIFGDAQWYSISLLAKSTPFADNNIIYAIHTYEPFVFTHQSANWTDLKTVKNLMFPYDKEKWSKYSADFGVTKAVPKNYKNSILNYYRIGNKEYILKTILPAKEWAVKNNVPIIINEFGAYNLKTDKQSVLNYMTAMREIGDTLQIPLTHWGYTGGFALFESEGASPKGTKLIEGMKEAFGL
ncbi:cellulase family glycosylhydrolase [uncultured Fibrobacter sp.]|uniref:cellulase family glycosylhydrolase n=1 Tax=uncultured Fibrobacter sp. TaxID=261512 RepID=UPI0034501A4F